MADEIRDVARSFRVLQALVKTLVLLGVKREPLEHLE